MLSDKGVASFSALQDALSAGRTEVDALLCLRPSASRRRRPQRARAAGRAQGEAPGADRQQDSTPLHYSEHFTEPGRTMLAHACRMGLEGVISKRADAPYEAGRGPGWMKSKCTLRQEFVILGYVPSDATGRGLRSLVVGYHKNGKLQYGGRVGTGFSGTVAHDLKKRLDRTQVAKKPPVVERAGAGQAGRLGEARTRRRGRIPQLDGRTASCARRPSRVCARTSRRARWSPKRQSQRCAAAPKTKPATRQARPSRRGADRCP